MLTTDHHPKYAVDGKLSMTGTKVFATKVQLNPYFLWQLPSLTNIIGVTITSINEEAGKGTESINSIKGSQVRAGTVLKEIVKECIVEIFEESFFPGSNRSRHNTALTDSTLLGVHLIQVFLKGNDNFTTRKSF